MRQLRELCHLCDIGGVTEEEFTRERAKLAKILSTAESSQSLMCFTKCPFLFMLVILFVSILLSFWSILIIFQFSGVLFAFQSRTLEESTPSSRLFLIRAPSHH